MIKTLADLDQYEDNLIAQFKQQVCFQRLATFSNAQFFQILLQRRFLSLAFTPIYDLAIDGMPKPSRSPAASCAKSTQANGVQCRHIGKI